MTKEKEMGFFLEIFLYSYQVFELRFEIRDPKLPPTPNFSVIHKKTKKQQRDYTFLVVKTHQNDNDIYKIKMTMTSSKFFTN